MADAVGVAEVAEEPMVAEARARGLPQALGALARTRRNVAARKREAQALQTVVDALPEVRALQDALRVLHDAEAAEAQLARAARDYTLVAFRETGDKAPAPGVTVKLYQTIRYPDEGRLLDWCLERPHLRRGGHPGVLQGGGGDG